MLSAFFAALLEICKGSNYLGSMQLEVSRGFTVQRGLLAVRARCKIPMLRGGALVRVWGLGGNSGHEALVAPSLTVWSGPLLFS